LANQQNRTRTAAPQGAEASAFTRQDNDQPPANAQPQASTDSHLPEPVRRRGIDEPTWRSLCNSIFPGALPESIIMAVDYCRARNLDVLKKPCHIVGMLVTERKKREHDGQVVVDEKKVWRDVILPGIYEYRITARRTGEYLGHTEPEFGPAIDFAGLEVPAWCAMTFYRWSEKIRDKVPYPVKVLFNEVVATKQDGTPNAKWARSPLQMLTKCTEAAGLREAFPDELGGEPTSEEMEGHTFDSVPEPARRALKPQVEAPRAKRTSEANGAPSATNQAPTETGAPPTTAAADPSTGEVLATPEQVAHLRRLCDKTGVPENEACRQFDVDTFENVAFDQVAGVVAWIDRASKG
jgi:phage recombination protein Bet